MQKPVEPHQRAVWQEFQLTDMRVPRTTVDCKECECPMCRLAHYNRIGVVGSRSATLNPVINTLGGPMDCKVQPKVAIVHVVTMESTLGSVLSVARLLDVESHILVHQVRSRLIGV